MSYILRMLLFFVILWVGAYFVYPIPLNSWLLFPALLTWSILMVISFTAWTKGSDKKEVPDYIPQDRMH